MALEESGIKFVTEGEAEFNSALESANKSLAELGDTSQVTAGMMDDASSSIDVAGEIIIGALRHIGEVALDALMAAGGAFVDFAAQSFQGAIESEEALAKLESTIRATGGVAGVTADKATELATSLSQVTKFSDDSVIAAETLLLTFTNIGSDVFPQATETLLDMATIMGTDAKSGAIQLGKALNDPAEGLSALTRVGVTFTAEQEKMVKQMVAAGDVAGAQKVILNELQREFGGAAQAAGDTFAGRLEIFKNAIGEAGEAVAGQFLPILTELAAVIFPQVIAGANELAALTETVVIPAFLQLGSTVFEWGTGAMNSVNQAWKVIVTAFDSIVVKAQPVMLAVDNLLAVFAEDMPMIQAAVNTALTFIQNLWDIVFPSIASTTDNTLNQIMTLTANILNTIAAYWDENGTSILAQATFYIQATAAIIGGTLSLISGVVSATLSIINGDWEAAGEALQSATTAFMNAILSIVGTNLQDFLAVWEGAGASLMIILSTTFNNVVAAIARGMNDAISAAQAIVGGFQDIGRAIIGGMIQGVIDTAVGLANAVYNAVNDAISGGQAAADIHSPSRKTREKIGQPLGEGMELGIEDTARQVEQALALSIHSAIGSISPDMSAFGKMLSGSIAPPASAGQIAAQSVYNSSLSNTLTINAQYPMQSARSIADDLRMWTMLTGNSAA